MTLFITWLIRFGHVLAASVWLGGYFATLVFTVPLLRRHTSDTLERAALGVVRWSTYAGTATLFFGLLLIMRTRGFAVLTQGEWGGIVLTCLLIAVAVLGIGDGALRPALRHLAATGEAKRARLWAATGLALLALAYALMTRALYAAT